ncbi:MAG: glycosyltransferase, partial [Thermodesulfobium sp.]
MTKTAREVTKNYNIIMVNDGSPDASLEIALRLQKKDSKIIVVDLSRNFGHHKAIMAGLEHAKGDKVFLIDCDLEEEPELLKEFYNVQKKKKCDVVFGVVTKRKKGWILDKLSNMALYLYKFLSDINSPKNQATIRLMTAEYVKSLLEFHERELFLEGLFYLTGYNQVFINFDKKSKNDTSYTLPKRIGLFVTALCSFSSKPLVYMFYC